MSEENKSLIHRLYEEVFDRGYLDVAHQLYASDAVTHNPAGRGDSPEPDGIRQSVEAYRAAFRDSQVVIEDMVAEGDRVVVRYTARGVHAGALLGVPPTGKNVESRGVAIHRIAYGRIAESWIFRDDIGLLKQLGVMDSTDLG